MSIDIDNLEALAWAATKGPWIAVPVRQRINCPGGRSPIFDDGRWVILPEWHTDRVPLAEVDHADDHHAPAREHAENDAQFIAAADPKATLALIDRLREAETREQALAAHVERLRGVAENMDHFNDDEDLAEAEVALSDADDTLDEVFAQRDARVAAETYRSFRQEFDCYKGGEKVGVATVRFMLDRWEQKMRRQAEQAGPDKEGA